MSSSLALGRSWLGRQHTTGLRAWRTALISCFLALVVPYASTVTAATADTVERVKPSIVAIGTVQKTRSPQFLFLGTGFVVGAGKLVATNAHVLKRSPNGVSDSESLVVAIPSEDPNRSQVRAAKIAAEDAEKDLAILRIEGDPLPPLRLRDSRSVRDGEPYLMTGFPLGNVLGLYPVTHRMMIAAISPIAIPTPMAQNLDAKMIRQIQRGAFPIFQLDGTSYPGNSGSPLYDASSGEVVGVMNMALIRSTRESALSQPSGITYAIPSVHLIELLKKVSD